MVNQVEYAIGQIRPATVRFCEELGMVMEAYSPLNVGELLRNPQVKLYAKKYNVTPAQLCYRFVIQTGVIPLSKSVKRERIKSNTDVFGFTISDEDMMMLRYMPYCGGSGNDPDRVDWK